MALSIVILAAGQGTRMVSDLPKVLAPLAGRPLLAHVIDASSALEADGTHVVVGFGADTVREAFAGQALGWHEQTERKGTGHAVAQAMPAIPDDHTVLVLYGDVPLVQAETLRSLVAAAGDSDAAVLTAMLDDPTGYGRIVRAADGSVSRIVEQKDASSEEAAIHEVNTGLIACPAGPLKGWLDEIRPNNAQGEYYLTDIIALAVRDGIPVHGVAAANAEETAGINDRAQLAECEAQLRTANAAALLKQGVTLADPTRVDVRGELECGRDVFIDINVVFEGKVKLGDGVHIGPNNVISDSQIEDGTEVKTNSVIDQAHIGPRCSIGPFARVRPATYLGSEVKIGNFVETKKSAIAKGSKVSHLTYIGDSTIGEDVNVGAGTITCNYDGVNKHKTRIDDGAFIGSGTQLVAPVSVGENATIGAGSVISKDAPAGELTVARGKQVTLRGWKRPEKLPKDP
ncbi:MAG: bifunctional UDP-N-acetylglucosamine diphosphorylase/glucosamine-1-phosphate N-acetyltransferase GlmU [Pseudomonadota bacterium]